MSLKGMPSALGQARNFAVSRLAVHNEGREARLNRPVDPQLAAFRRLLEDAHLGGQAKVDALLALSQRTVFLVPWPGGVEGWRTLVNRDGVAALPMFSGVDELEEAARRYGWLDGHGNAPHQEVGARAAFNYAIRESLAYVVLDIASKHALEMARAELEPLVSSAARRDSSGPYAGAGKISSTLIRAVRNTPPPMRAADTRTPVPPPIAPPAIPTPVLPPAAAVPTTASAGPSGEPSEDLLDALSAVLRNYPEAEWAAILPPPRRAVGVRIDPSFRRRVEELVAHVRRASESQSAGLEVVLLDDPALMRSARGQGLVFYPWRKK
jgi:hypothetical protein